MHPPSQRQGGFVLSVIKDIQLLPTHRRIPRHLWNELKRGVHERPSSLPPSIHALRIASSQLAAVVNSSSSSRLWSAQRCKTHRPHQRAYHAPEKKSPGKRGDKNAFPAPCPVCRHHRNFPARRHQRQIAVDSGPWHHYCQLWQKVSSRASLLSHLDCRILVGLCESKGKGPSVR